MASPPPVGHPSLLSSGRLGEQRLEGQAGLGPSQHAWVSSGPSRMAAPLTLHSSWALETLFLPLFCPFMPSMGTTSHCAYFWVIQPLWLYSLHPAHCSVNSCCLESSFQPFEVGSLCSGILTDKARLKMPQQD